MLGQAPAQQQEQQRNKRGRNAEVGAVGVPALKEGGLSPERKDQVIECRHCGGKPIREDGKRGEAYYTLSKIRINEVTSRWIRKTTCTFVGSVLEQRSGTPLKG